MIDNDASDATIISRLDACQRQMLRQGMRRILVLSGEFDWCGQTAQQVSRHFSGDWLWVSPNEQDTSPRVKPEAVNQLLGQEFLNGVFDAREGLNVEALAAFSGVLRAGSWLILLVPKWQEWPTLPDADSIRWTERSEAIATPRFISRFCQSIEADTQALLWRQNSAFSPQLLSSAPDWTTPQGEPTPGQRAILDQLLQAEDGIWVLTAARGRGKSTLAGMLVQHWQGACWMTAPSKAAGQRLSEQGEEAVQFWAPDALLAHCESGAAVNADWLLIDEAAAIPAPLLQRLIPFFPRVLLTTTVQGYEGTGRGFLLKFCASLTDWQDLRLTAPIRWAQQDPLERLLDDILLFDEPDYSAVSPNGASAPVQVKNFDAAAWEQSPDLLADFYHLLTSAHYRTSPLDLRRMMDAPGMSFAAGYCDNALSAALWLVDEGGLQPDLAHEIWAGRRRPRGNLVAQSLAAHAGFPEAAVMLSRRITRIAVSPAQRRRGVAQALVSEQQQFAAAQGLDFLSVSFGFTDPLWRFWQRCGFETVRVGGQREASSGCFAAMAVLPLSPQGQSLCQQAKRRLSKNRRQVPVEVAEVIWPQKTVAEDALLDDGDWRELAGFAFASRSLDSSRSALLRLLARSTEPLPALRAILQQGNTLPEVVSTLRLSGKKALLACWREETRRAMQSIDPTRCARAKQFAE
ncbi:tRNA(Met) cytidine acetyltransferase TmcA [Rouxiella badensis]|uniref:tRNA(Met) cytidine acetyltransferase TmcA n=1 Tax=Rouxiella badensis TaxID=1646377 RepID=UPI0022AA56F4|nr:GNAT family N-acetyltransferase [Rouxiella badensis]WAT09279.1 GNAT family N-acetyltransferase [Rouxiella badensis]